MRLLLDTHVLLRALSDPARLDRQVLAELDRADVYVSAASIWEIALKARIGKLLVDAENVLRALEPAGFVVLPVTGEHAARVASLGTFRGDPFDWLLVAQAKAEAMTLLTHDEALLEYGSCVRLG